MWAGRQEAHSLNAPIVHPIDEGDLGGTVSHQDDLQVAAGSAAVDLDRCTSEAIVVATNKGGFREPVRATHFELALHAEP